jgi:cytochrome c peroxidase
MAQDGCFSLAACHQQGVAGMRTLSKVAKAIGIGATTSTAMDAPTNCNTQCYENPKESH